MIVYLSTCMQVLISNGDSVGYAAYKRFLEQPFQAFFVVNQYWYMCVVRVKLNSISMTLIFIFLRHHTQVMSPPKTFISMKVIIWSSFGFGSPSAGLLFYGQSALIYFMAKVFVHQSGYLAFVHSVRLQTGGCKLSPRNAVNTSVLALCVRLLQGE